MKKLFIFLLLGIFMLSFTSAFNWNDDTVVSYWKLDEQDSGTGTIIDAMIHNNGTNVGADNVTGKIIYGYDFVAASTDSIDLGDVELLSNANGGAISFWFKVCFFCRL